MSFNEVLEFSKVNNFFGRAEDDLGKIRFKFIKGRMYTYSPAKDTWNLATVNTYWLLKEFTIEHVYSDCITF